VVLLVLARRNPAPWYRSLRSKGTHIPTVIASTVNERPAFKRSIMS